MLDFEDKLYSEKVINIVGIDEAGRGPLLGPVVAAAVILKKDFNHPLINDSKKLTEKEREIAYQIIKDNALAIGIGQVEAEEIDQINILEAARKAFKLALDNIKIPYQLVLTDYMNIETNNVKLISLIKGDAKSKNIAAASIIAKVTRDHLMYELDKKYPDYKIKDHKGYGTKVHLEALKKYGPIKGVHRLSFKPVKNIKIEQIKLF